jgi:hypothetical protein
MFLLNNVPLPLDTPFRDADGNSYPANWLRLTSLEEKQAIGITEVPDPEPEIVVVPEVVAETEPEPEPEPIVVAPAEPDTEPEVPSE